MLSNSLYIIRNVDGQWWSNEYSWVTSQDLATTYNQHERNTLGLATTELWEKLA